MTVLAWGYSEWKATYQEMGLHTEMEETLRWGLDHLLKMYDAEENLFYTKVSHVNVRKNL